MTYLDRHVQKLAPQYTSHKSGRYVTDPTGFLRGKDFDRVDLHRFLTEHSPSVELMPIHTKEMRISGLHPGGFALVNRAIRPYDGAIVVVRYNSQIVVRRLVKRQGAWLLVADDPREKDLGFTEFTIVEKIGVIKAAIIQF